MYLLIPGTGTIFAFIILNLINLKYMIPNSTALITFTISDDDLRDELINYFEDTRVGRTIRTSLQCFTLPETEFSHFLN